MGQVDDVRQCVTMDLKEAGNALFQVGVTRDEMGGSHFALVRQLQGGRVPEVIATQAKATFAAVHQAIQGGLVRSCHDMSEGGLAVTLAEMAFAGALGAKPMSTWHHMTWRNSLLFNAKSRCCSPNPIHDLCVKCRRTPSRHLNGACNNSKSPARIGTVTQTAN